MDQSRFGKILFPSVAFFPQGLLEAILARLRNSETSLAELRNERPLRDLHAKEASLVSWMGRVSARAAA